VDIRTLNIKWIFFLSSILPSFPPCFLKRELGYGVIL